MEEREEEEKSGPLTTEELASLGSRGSWRLQWDEGLLGTLELGSASLLSSSKELRQRLDGLASQASQAQSRLSNAQSRLAHMANQQFLEARVYDEHPSSAAQSEAFQRENHPPPSDADKRAAIADALRAGLALLGTHFQRLDTPAMLPADKEEDRDEEDEEKMELYEALDPYAAAPLPAVIGSEDFYRLHSLGLSLDEEENESLPQSPKAILVSIPPPPPHSDSSGLADADEGYGPGRPQSPHQHQHQHQHHPPIHHRRHHSEEEDEKDLFTGPSKAHPTPQGKFPPPPPPPPPPPSHPAHPRGVPLPPPQKAPILSSSSSEEDLFATPGKEKVPVLTPPSAAPPTIISPGKEESRKEKNEAKKPINPFSAIPPPVSKGLFDSDDDDDDIFAVRKALNPPTPQLPSVKPTTLPSKGPAPSSHSLFHSDDSDDDFFTSVSKKPPPQTRASSSTTSQASAAPLPPASKAQDTPPSSDASIVPAENPLLSAPSPSPPRDVSAPTPTSTPAETSSATAAPPSQSPPAQPDSFSAKKPRGGVSIFGALNPSEVLAQAKALSSSSSASAPTTAVPPQSSSLDEETSYAEQDDKEEQKPEEETPKILESGDGPSHDLLACPAKSRPRPPNRRLPRGRVEESSPELRASAKDEPPLVAASLSAPLRLSSSDEEAPRDDIQKPKTETLEKEEEDEEPPSPLLPQPEPTLSEKEVEKTEKTSTEQSLNSQLATPKPVVQSKISKSIFDDDSDDDLFGSALSKRPTLPVTVSKVEGARIKAAEKESRSLFDDDSDDDILASARKASNSMPHPPPPQAQPSKVAAPVKTAKSSAAAQKTSIFDDSSDEDLFKS